MRRGGGGGAAGRGRRARPGRCWPVGGGGGRLAKSDSSSSISARPCCKASRFPRPGPRSGLAGGGACCACCAAGLPGCCRGSGSLLLPCAATCCLKATGFVGAAAAAAPGRLGITKVAPPRATPWAAGCRCFLPGSASGLELCRRLLAVLLNSAASRAPLLPAASGAAFGCLAVAPAAGRLAGHFSGHKASTSGSGGLRCWGTGCCSVCFCCRAVEGGAACCKPPPPRSAGCRGCCCC